MTEKEFEKYWIEKLRGEIKYFPSDFTAETELEEIFTDRKVLTIGGEFFGSFEIIDTDGKIVANADDYLYAKYLIYASLAKPETIKIPIDKNAAKNAVKYYEKYLDSLINEIHKDFSLKLPDSKNFNKVSNAIFNALNLRRY